ncbi:tyrosine-type recombinase/integrase [Planctomycetota bacterium]
MNKIDYRSVLGGHLADFVALRQSLGYVYRTQPYVLRQFDRILQHEMRTEGPVTQNSVEAYLRSLEGLRPTTCRIRLSIVRQFLIYLRWYEPETFVPHPRLLPGPALPRPPHIYSDEELEALLAEALCYPHRHRVRRWILYHTLIAFLYATGLRISEALSLNLDDVDLSNGLVHVRKTKFHKTRVVPLAPSSLDGVKRYLIARAERGHSTAGSAPFFVNDAGKPLPHSTVRQAFRQIVRRAGLDSSSHSPAPRLHDLRHTAAVKRLHLWYREGEDVQTLLPVLVTYLGHSAVRCTEIYLTATAELLAEAGGRFERCFPLDDEPDGGTLS